MAVSAFLILKKTEHQKNRGRLAPVLDEKELLLAVEESVERLHELVGIDAVHRAGICDRLSRGVRAVEAVHAEGHEDRRDFGIKAHHRSDGHIGSDHGKTFFLKN